MKEQNMNQNQKGEMWENEGEREKGKMGIEEAGQKGGQKVKRLVEEGKEAETEGKEKDEENDFD